MPKIIGLRANVHVEIWTAYRKVGIRHTCLPSYFLFLNRIVNPGETMQASEEWMAMVEFHDPESYDTGNLQVLPKRKPRRPIARFSPLLSSPLESQPLNFFRPPKLEFH